MNTDDLVRANLPLALFLARKYYRRLPVVRQLGTLDDARQEALIALMDAAASFDPARGCAFSAHAGQEIPRRLVSRGRACALIRVPDMTAQAALRGGFVGGRRVVRGGAARAALAAMRGVRQMAHIRGQAMTACPAPRRHRGYDTDDLREAFARLRPAERSLLGQLFGLDGRPPRTTGDVAREEGVTPQLISQRYQKVRERLRGFLTGTFWEWD